MGTDPQSLDKFRERLVTKSGYMKDRDFCPNY